MMFFVYLAMVCAFFAEVTLGRKVFLEADIYPFYYPMWNFAVEEMRAGRFPLWNPFNCFGTPFFANPQTCVLYPASLLLYLGGLYRAINTYILFHLALAGFSTYLFARHLGSSKKAAFLAGAAFCLGGYALSTVRLTISLCSTAYFPLVLLAYFRAFKKPGPPAVAGTAAALLLQYLAGDPALTAATMLVLFCTAAYASAQHRTWKPLALLGASTALFLALGAFQILLFSEFISLSSRTALTLEQATRWSFPWQRAQEIFTPGLAKFSWVNSPQTEGKPWLENAYAGFAVCFFALWTLRRKMTSAEKALWALFLWGLLLSLGKYGPVYETAFRTVPFFSLLRYPQRFLFLCHFALALLAAFGFDRLAGSLPARGKKALLLLLFLTVPADLFLFQRKPIQVEPGVMQASFPNVETALKDPGLFRVMSSPQVIGRAFETGDLSFEEEVVNRRNEFFPNLPLLDRLHYVMGYDSLFLRETHRWNQALFNQTLDEARRVLSEANVKYVASVRRDFPGFEAVNQTTRVNLLIHQGVKPRAYWQAFDGSAAVEASIESYEPSRVRMRVTAPEAGELLFLDAYYPGWHATVDGRPETILLKKNLFRGLRLEAGVHTVEWRYNPPLFKTGLWLSALAGLLALGMAAGPYIKLK